MQYEELEIVRKAIQQVEKQFSDVGTGAYVAVTFYGSSFRWGVIKFSTEWKSGSGEIEFNGDLVEKLNRLAKDWSAYKYC